MKYIFITILLTVFTITNSFSQVESLIPSKWNIVLQQEGDFNKDGMKDYFVVGDSMDSKETWMCQKRMLLIYHGSTKGLYLADKNNLIFIERSRMVSTDVMELTIKDNVVKLGLGDMNLGGACNGGMGYTFRFQNNSWYAIGCGSSCSKVFASDTTDSDGQVTEQENFSYNFVTGNYERIVKVDEKVISSTLKKRAIKLPRFSEYDGECDELIK